MLLDLDHSELTLSLDRTEKELALKANRQLQLKLDMERTLDDLKGHNVGRMGRDPPILMLASSRMY